MNVAARSSPARLTPEDLDVDQRALYDAITSGPRAAGPQHFRLVDDRGGLEGPFNAFLLRPALGGPLQTLGAAIRYATSFDDRAREIAILVVASAWDSAFERHAHEPIGRAAGLTDDEIEAIAAGPEADTPDRWPRPEDFTLVRAARALSLGGDLDDALYRDAVELLGEAGLFELTTLVGYYATLALQLRVFGVSAPEPLSPEPLSPEPLSTEQGPNP